MSRNRSRREFLKTLPLAGAAMVAGGSLPAEAQTRAPDDVAERRVRGPAKKSKDQKDKDPKNKPKGNGGWCTDDLFFDQEGCLFIADVALAQAIQDSVNAWGGRLCMSRLAFEGEKSSDGGPIEGNKVNMLCPC